MARKEEGLIVLCLVIGVSIGIFLTWIVIESVNVGSVNVQKDTLNNVCKVVAGDDTKFLKTSWMLDENENNKQVIECTKIKIFDDGSIVLK